MKYSLYGHNLKPARNAFILMCLAVPVSLLAQTIQDPVVIQLPDRQLTLAEYNTQFEVAARMLAIKQGIEYDSLAQEQKDKLRVQYLRQRASELVMLQQADVLGVQTDQQQLDMAVADYFHIGGEGKDKQQVLQLGGFSDETQLRHYLAEQERIRLVTAKLLSQIVVPPGDVMTLHHDLADQLVTPEQICMRQIAVADEQTARQLLEDLNGGADFAAIAREHSTDRKTGENGGDMGCFEREGKLARSEFESAAFSAKEGEITGPVKSDFGYHLILVYDRIEAHTPTLNEAYADLEDEIRHEKLPDVLAEIIDASGVQTFPDKLDIKGSAEK